MGSRREEKRQEGKKSGRGRRELKEGDREEVKEGKIRRGK